MSFDEIDVYKTIEESTTEWITYEFEKPVEVSRSSVFWYDDSPWGSCRIPESWKLYYQDASGNWKAVENTSEYKTVKGMDNTVRFKPVTTKAMKIEVKQPEKNASGLFEWAVE